MKLQVGVKALLRNEQGLYLFIRRRDELPDGSGIRWDVPGGRIQTDETLAEALAREISEETGIGTIGLVELLDAQDIIVPEADVHVVRLTYTAQASGEPKLSDEHAEYQWLPLAAARELAVDNYLQRTLKKIA